MTRPAEKTDRYLPQLDGLRAIAVLLVVVQHWIANPFNLGAPFGFIGVTVFFVLSGYLISRILFEARERLDQGKASLGASLKTFYMRRFLRIFPIYYLTIFFLYAIGDGPVRGSIGWLATYTANFYFLLGGNRLTTGHLWTLAIEEQYYIVYPFLVLLCTPRQRLRALGAMCLLAFTSRIALDLHGVSVADNKYFTLCCFDSFAMGGLLAHWEFARGKASLQAVFRKPMTGVLVVATVLAFGALGAMLGDKASLRVVWFRTVISLASLYVIGLALLENPTLGRLLGNRAVVFLGKVSYGLYLYHLYAHRMLVFLFPGAVTWPLPLLLAGLSAVTLAVTTASWFLIEKPINSLKSKFSYEGRPAKATPAPSP